MPDTIVTFTRGADRFLVTANEGDERPDNGDRIRVGTGTHVDSIDSGSGDLFFSGNRTNSDGIGRLNISTIDGNTDADAGIEVPTAFGTRSFSIFNATTGARVFDSASLIEEYVAANDPTTFNFDIENDNGNPATGSALDDQIDKRSDNKGPEPEALAFATIGGRDFVFVGAERQNGIFQFDITDFDTNPSSVGIVAYFNTLSSNLDSGGDFISPETMRFVAAADNITGLDLLIVGYEGTPDGFTANGTANPYGGSIAVYAVSIPEPSTFALIGLAAGAGLVIARRRRK
jgi:hypothetical protein